MLFLAQGKGNLLSEDVAGQLRKLERGVHPVDGDHLGHHLLHVSSSPRYDLMPAHDTGIKNKVFVNRGHEPSPNAFYSHVEIRDINGLPGLVGL